MVVLPDTDSALDTAEARGQVEGQVKDQVKGLVRASQQITRPMHWSQPAQSNKHAHYQRDSTGWTAALAETAVAAANATKVIHLDGPVALNPLSIPKPWGQEIWFSGIEERGESTITQNGTTLPLSDYLSLAPNRLVRRAEPLLLKILDPAPAPVTGNLYVETHNTKHEVYVVTHVDSKAWPSGVGAIRLGMNQSTRQHFANDQEFRGAYLAAVKAYEAVRRAIDDDPAQAKELQAQEQSLRSAMEDFTAIKPLAVGDVVQVSPHIPHSLQYGVRVFEFQTPTYERNIISFNQRVLTQDHWDSEYAIEHMSLDGPSAPVIDTVTKTPEAVIERIVDFADFEVQRATVEAHASIAADLADGYLMVAVLKGSVQLRSAAHNLTLVAGTQESECAQAGLIPASADQAQLSALEEGATFLIAKPKSSAANKIPLS